ncbi:hypothetical protein [Spiroplasma apis]|uniref:Transmembrane protein n=1 Tax=Spiroplasma apis B31 TaxID=1276258 RepID=V5RI38_SPIAP|nr:hypothetical protein [Spiroplasma apis]AHB36352.1 hypothetical protein SAPIS_v1c05070 [Spiroplasma apis B31]
MKNKSKINNLRAMNSPFAKYRSMIWVNVITLIILVIFSIITFKMIGYLFTSYKTFAWVFISLFVLFYNFGFVAMYKMSKHLVLYNLLSCIVILLMIVSISFFVTTTDNKSKLIILSGLFLSLIPLLLSTIFAYIRVKEVYKYIAFNETLYDLEKRNFVSEDKEAKIKLYLKPGHFYFQINGVRKKYPTSKITNLVYKPANIFFNVGYISFKINNEKFIYKYSSAYEDGIMFSLAYNILRINKNALKDGDE